ncbi:hypothetical protein RIF29_06726 [Crotalaria pallida]|uniref:Uncharacterized protein n=1 Tax=Crotalaria pallida TaxID=3830 RepID=A0AAN9J3M7_CROPI
MHWGSWRRISLKRLSERVSNISLTGAERLEKFLLEKLDVYESAVGDSNVKCAPRITGFPPDLICLRSLIG